MWGFATPRLDRVWQLHHELKIGAIAKLKNEDQVLLEGALRDYPTLAGALISRGDIGVVSTNRNGWIETPFITLVRTGNAKTQELLVNVETSPEHLPFRVEFEGPNWKQDVEITERKEYRVAIPPSSGVAEIISGNVKGKRFKNDPAILGVQIHFTGEEQWQEIEEGDEDAEEVQ